MKTTGVHAFMVAIAMSLFASNAAAQDAPFCVVAPAGTQCIYFDLNFCRQSAQALGGLCAANPAQMLGGSSGTSGAARDSVLSTLAEQMRRAEQDARARQDHEIRMKILQEQLKVLQEQNKARDEAKPPTAPATKTESTSSQPCYRPLSEYLKARDEGRDWRTIPCH